MRPWVVSATKSGAWVPIKTVMTMLLSLSNRSRSVRQNVVGDLRSHRRGRVARAAKVHAAKGASLDAVAGHFRDARVAPRLHSAFGWTGKDTVESRMNLKDVGVTKDLLKDARAGAVRALMRCRIFGMIGRRDQRRPVGDRRGIRIAVEIRLRNGEDWPPGHVRGI